LPWYRCLVRGENFPLESKPGSGVRPHGFYATRCVEADTPEAAEMAALNLLRYEDTFAPPAGHARSKDARVYFEKIEAVSGPQTEGGASWFPMDA
jgi:hypothetical protein